MSKLTCKCLNVSLNINEEGTEATRGTKLLGLEPENGNDVDDFFQKELLLVSLAVAGIEVQQSMLVKEREVQDYKVFKCINCEMSTHATHKFKGLERVIASADMGDSLAFNKLRDSQDYSPVFKIVLKAMQTSNDYHEESPGHGQAKMFHQSLSDANAKVHEIVKKFLLIEEQAMQERIRIFTEQQQEMFRKLQRKITADKNTFLGLINKKEEHALETSLTDAMDDAILGTKRNPTTDSESEDLAPDLPQIKDKKSRKSRLFMKSSNNEHQLASNSLPKHLPPSRVLVSHDDSSSKRPPVSKNQAMVTTEPVATTRSSDHSTRQWKSYTGEDALFDLDGFQENKPCEPFFESDEESSGDSNSLDSSGGYTIPSKTTAADRIYATSVPVGIPMFHAAPPRRESYEEDDDSDLNAPVSPDRIAESMKALARSLYDSTSIFGELPTPRYK